MSQNETREESDELPSEYPEHEGIADFEPDYDEEREPEQTEGPVKENPRF